MTKATQTPKANQQSNNKPVHVFKARGMKAAVFANVTDQGVFHKVSLQRVYREGEEWKTTTSLGRDDLPVATMLLERAWMWILDTEAAKNREDNEQRGD